MDKNQTNENRGEIKQNLKKFNLFLVIFQLMGIVKYHIIIF